MSTFIFDFDGTLANTLEALFEIANGLSDEFGFAPLDDIEFLRLRGLSSREILQEGHISIWKLPRLVRRIKREQQAIMANVQMVVGMKEVLLALSERGDRLGIATSNSSENIQLFLQNNGLNGRFDFTVTGISLFGKARALRKIVRQQQLNPAETIYVGDEVRDVVAAQEVGIHSLGVGWGFNTVAALEDADAEFVVERPQDILRLALSSEIKAAPSALPLEEGGRGGDRADLFRSAVPFPSHALSLPK